MHSFKDRRILLGISGGIAAYKSPEIVRLIVKEEGQVKIILTSAGERFITRTTLETVSGNRVYCELFPSNGIFDPAHISLARWCDALLVAPATADIIAKAAHGLADDLLSTVLLAVEKPVFFVPSMNPSMYHHRATVENLKMLTSRGIKVLEPDFGPLATLSEGSGVGRFPEAQKIVEWLNFELEETNRDMEGYRVLITAGPTVEEIDPVRYLSNRSSGKMGFALAVEAVRRGAEVLLIHGPVNLPLPPGVRTVAVKTAEEMMAAVKSEYPHYHIVLMAAAVADFKPLIKSADKIKKREHLTLELVKTPDILQWMGENRTKQYLVGFSLESEENIAEARRKLIEKRANLLILNSIEAMEADENRVILISEQSEERPPLMSKQMVAKFIFNRIISEIK